ncbi:MAG: hypothetical protein CMJ18_09480 [Phycisphaeraceae bacterium]|nr:hypothetical protein [Phycisphaeraceae bacterium]
MGNDSAPPSGQPVSLDALRVEGARLRWCCDESSLAFETTAELEPLAGVIGQDDAIEALRFGLEINAPGQNIFVRGLTGTGRMSLLEELMQQISPACPLADDRCYVHNFEHPSRPSLITLGRGQARPFAARIDELIEFIRSDLVPHLSSESMRTRQAALEEEVQRRMRSLDEPLQKELAANELALMPVKMGQTVKPAIFPVRNGKPVSPDEFAQLRSQGQIDDETARRIQEKSNEFAKRLREVGEKIAEIQEVHRTALRQLFEDESRSVLDDWITRIERQFPDEAVGRFLSGMVEDLVGKRLGQLKESTDFLAQYRVNVVQPHGVDDGCPIVIENVPTIQNLLGSIEREFLPGGMVRSDHMSIQSGALLRADGGYLILEARDVLNEPGAWKVLVRTLRSGRLEVIPTEFQAFWAGPSLKPEPIEVNVKVILLGDPGLYQLLDHADPDFSHLFKVVADFDTTIDRDQRGVELYARVLARIAKKEKLLPFSRTAVAALTEHGARIAGQRERLTTRFGRLADLAREAAFAAGKQGKSRVDGEEVREAVRSNRRRGDLPARRFRRMISEGLIQIETSGMQVGQINGLAVVHAGPLTYGFPSRITATVGAGTAGAINIEREAQLSGAIHTKGFYILGGLLRHLLRTNHPLAFSASIAFEQSYGGIDGDSASGAEMCCLLSALTGVALRQEVAMTGAIDQRGHVQVVGAVAEKIEGFYDTCLDTGLSGSQGVIIPRACLEDIMLRPDVVAACDEGTFHVYAVHTIHEALEVLTGQPAGRCNESGEYPDGTLLHAAVAKVREYWQMAGADPNRAAKSDAEVE